MNLEESKNCEHDNIWRMYSPLGICLLNQVLSQMECFLKCY